MNDILLKFLSSAEEAEAFEPLTFPAYTQTLSAPATVRPNLSDQPGACLVEPIALGAFDAVRPIGLLLAENPLEPPSKLAKGVVPAILSVAIDPAYRERGIATSLVQKALACLVARGATGVRASYTSSLPSAPAIERLAARAGFATTVTGYRSVFPVTVGSGQPWRENPLPKEYHCLPWHEVPKRTLRNLRHDQTTDCWIPEALRPWRFDKRNRHPASSGLLRHGALVGWLLVYENEHDTAELRCGYIRPDLGRLGRGLQLVGFVLNKLATAGVTNCTVGTYASYPGMVRLMTRLLADTVGVHESRGLYRHLP